MSGSEHHHVLVAIERAQREGRTESEITRLVEERLGSSPSDERTVSDDRRLVKRLLPRRKLPNAA